MFRQMRRTDKQMTNSAAIDLLKRGREGILGTISDNGYPYTVVLNYVYHNNKIYFHCTKEGHKIDNIKSNDKVSFSVYDNVKVIGDELNTKYQSVTLFGKARVLAATKEILRELVKKYSQLQNEETDNLINKEIDITAIVEIEIEHITGKEGK